MDKNRNRLVLEALADRRAKTKSEIAKQCELDEEACYVSIGRLMASGHVHSLPKVKGQYKTYGLTEKGVYKVSLPPNKRPSRKRSALYRDLWRREDAAIKDGNDWPAPANPDLVVASALENRHQLATIWM